MLQEPKSIEDISVTQPKKVTNMEALPEELIEMIFSFLEFHDLLKVPFVCHKWRKYIIFYYKKLTS